MDGERQRVFRPQIGRQRPGLRSSMPSVRDLSALGWTPDAPGVGAYADVAELADGCRFRDCAHGAEPGWAWTPAREPGSTPAPVHPPQHPGGRFAVRAP